MNKTILNRYNNLVKCGLLPHNINDCNITQKQICNEINTTDKFCFDLLVFKYLDYANDDTKRLFIYKKIKNKSNEKRVKNNRINIDISPDDIVLNDYCPFFNTKLNYNNSEGQGNKLNDTKFYSIDRIDNNIGYVKGNVQIISRLANRIKFDATNDELKLFCTNLILRYRK